MPDETPDFTGQLEQTLDGLAGRIGAVEEGLEALQGVPPGSVDLGPLNEAVGQLRADVDALTGAVESHTTAIGQSRQAVDDLQDAFAALSTRVNDTSAALELQLAAHRQLRSDFDALAERVLVIETGQEPPPPPPPLTAPLVYAVSGRAPAAVSAVWPAVPGATSYEAQLDTGTTRFMTAPSTLWNAVAAGTHTIRVRALRDAEVGPYGTVTFTVLAPDPGPQPSDTVSTVAQLRQAMADRRAVLVAPGDYTLDASLVLPTDWALQGAETDRAQWPRFVWPTTQGQAVVAGNRDVVGRSGASVRRVKLHCTAPRTVQPAGDGDSAFRAIAMNIFGSDFTGEDIELRGFGNGIGAWANAGNCRIDRVDAADIGWQRHRDGTVGWTGYPLYTQGTVVKSFSDWVVQALSYYAHLYGDAPGVGNLRLQGWRARGGVGIWCQAGSGRMPGLQFVGMDIESTLNCLVLGSPSQDAVVRGCRLKALGTKPCLMVGEAHGITVVENDLDADPDDNGIVSPPSSGAVPREWNRNAYHRGGFLVRDSAGDLTIDGTFAQWKAQHPGWDTASTWSAT